MLFLIKILRDLRKNKSRSLPIIILICVSQIASILYIEVGVMIDESWQQYFRETNVGDVWIDTVSISTTVYNNSVTSYWRDTYSISAIQPRLYFKGQITINKEKIPVDIISLPAEKPAEVNRIITTDKSYFADHSKINNGIYIEQSHLKFYNLKTFDGITLTINTGLTEKTLNLTILGGAYSPEYPIKMGEGGSIQQFEFSATFAQYLTMSVFLRTDYLQDELYQGEEVYNQICISFDDNIRKDTFIRHLQTDQSLMYRYTIDVREYPSLIEDMVFIMIGVGFGVTIFFLIISMFLTYTIVNRFIDEQRPQLGVMKSLGYSNRYILTRSLFYGLILGLIGSTSGNFFGICIGILLGDLLLNSWLSFPYIAVSLPFTQSLVLVFITIVCSTIACYISARRILKISPRAAIMPAFVERKISTFVVEDFIQKIFRIRLSVLSKYSIRNVFTNPKRAITTIGSLLMAIALVGGVLTIVTSVFSGGSLMFQSENWDAQITLSYPQNFADVQSDILMHFDDHQTMIMEPLLVDTARIRNPTDKDTFWRKVTFTALPMNPNLKLLENTGVGFQSNTSAIISLDVAKQLELNISGEYILSGRNGTQKTIIIQVILPPHHVSSFYIPMSLGNFLSFGNDSIEMVNGVFLSKPALSKTDIDSLSTDFAVILKSDLIKETESWYLQMSSILFGLLFLVLIIAGIIIYSIASISIAERKDDFSIMKAVGIQNRSIYLWSVLEVLIYSLIASSGYLIGFFISVWYMDILQQLMNSPQGRFELSLFHYLVSFLFGLVASLFGQFFALRYILKQRIAIVTKEKMFG
ncbi:MAG: FtsX-like permease family protein [Promethearchaeota archaeon]